MALTALGLIFVLPGDAVAGTAPTLLSNNSIHIYPADCSCGFGLTWTIHFSSVYTEYPEFANGEVAPLAQPAARSHYSYLILEDPSTVASTTFAAMDLPFSGGGNGNGTPDFFEVSQAVATESEGTYEVVWNPGYGQLKLAWSRSAGSRYGTCVLRMVDPILGEMGPYNHVFEIISYSGALNYTPGSNIVSGTLTLAQTDQPAETLSGPVSLVKAPTNRFDLLTLASGQWTNQAAGFDFGACELTRHATQPTVYRGVLQNPGGAYRHWQLTLVDTNDANGNGIPDLSDDLIVVTPPRRPTLGLSLAGSQLRLNVSGDTGRIILIQQATTLNPTNWTTMQSVNLTNDPQVITLPLPINASAFWRVQAQ